MGDSTNWKVETFRITLFPNDIANVSVERLWEVAIGEEPDEIHFQKGKFDAREIEFANGRMVLAKQNDRIDWRYLSKPDDDTDILQLPVIGGFKEELAAITEWAHESIFSPDMFAIKRLAFGAVLLQPVATLQDAYSFFEPLLPTLDLDGVQDFYYQVNRRRKSKVFAEIEINRLNKWNAYIGTLVNMAVNPSQKSQTSSTTDSSIASRLELDVNTWQENTEPLPSERLPIIFDELVELGSEICEDGDIN